MGDELMDSQPTDRPHPQRVELPVQTGEERPNVLILTGGLTGSSAFAGLLTASGYWCGEDTFKKSDYNTYENSELIRFNRQLMQRVAVGDEYTSCFLPEAIDHIDALRGRRTH